MGRTASGGASTETTAATRHSAVASAGAPDARASANGFHPFSLDALNFLASDVRGAVGPYLNIFLVTQQQWSQSEVGLVTMIGGLCGLAVQTPIGAAIDETRSKRGVIVLALAVPAITALVIFAWPVFWPVLIANSLMAVAGDVFGPAVAALTLGLYARKQLARRMGRNSAFDHAGNAGIALVAGAVGYAFSQRAVFLLVPVFALLTVIAVLSIPAKAIDYNRARDLEPEPGAAEGQPKVAGYGILGIPAAGHLRPLRHAVPSRQCAAAAARRAEARCRKSRRGDGHDVGLHRRRAAIALLVGYKADIWGRKPLFLAGFAILPIRAALYTLSDNSFWLVGVQVLDGVGAGIFGALTPLVVADIMRGTGRYAWGRRHGPGHRRLSERAGRRRDRRSFWIRAHVPVAGRGSRRRVHGLLLVHARNCRPGDGVAAAGPD